MKKIRLMALVMLLGTVSSVAFSPDTGMARVFAVFGPETFIRSTKAPDTEVRQFPVQYPGASEFTLHVFYGGIIKDLQGTVPSALIMLNGHQVVGPDEFNRNVRYINKPITLSQGNSLSIELRGKPGSGIRVVITAQNDEPRTFDFRDIIQPDGIDLLGPDLSYLWTIVDEPEDGNASLSDPYSPSPFLTVELPGEYTLELRVQSDSWESNPFLVNLAAIDMLAATYNDTPFVPVPVKSRVVNGEGLKYYDYSIKVGSNTYTAPAPGNCGSSSNSGFQVLVLNRDSLEKTDHRSFNVPCGSTAMANFLNTLDDTSLVIISSLNNAAPYLVCDNSSSCPLGAKLVEFGATSIFTSNYSQTLNILLPNRSSVNFSYSLIGIKGLGEKQGYELNNNDHRPVGMDSKIYSNIEGYFVPDANPRINKMWTFAYPEFIEIETSAQSSATSNTIKVGGVSYVSPPLAEVDYSPYHVEGGFQIVVLDRDTLKPAAALPLKGMQTNVTFSTGYGGYNEYEQSEMCDYLGTILNTGYPNQRFVAVIASIGAPIGHEDRRIWWNPVVQIIGYHYGGTLSLLNQVGVDSSTYALVGFGSSDSTPFGVHDAIDSASWDINLKVVLRRDKQGWFKPVIINPGSAGVSGGPDLSLLFEILKPSTPWPLPDPTLSTTDPLYQQQDNAYKYISSYVALTDKIRDNYWKEPISPETWLLECNTLQYPSTTPAPYFSQNDFNTMKNQLCGYHDQQGRLVPGEFHYVQAVQGFKEVMDYNVWVNMKISSSSRLRDVYAAVKPLVNVPDDRIISYNIGIVIRGILTAGTSIVKNPYLKGTMGVINGIMLIGMNLSKGEGGTDYTSLNTAVSSLGNQMDLLWANCQKGTDVALGIIKSDWGKLQYVGNKFMLPQDQGGWMWDTGDEFDWVDQITNTLEAYYFQSLIPAVWKIDYLEKTVLPKPCNYCYGASDIWCWLYSGCPESAYEVDQFSDGTYSWYVLRDPYSVKSGCYHVNFGNSTSLTDILFGQGDWLDSSGNYIGVKLNLSKPVFFQRWLPSSIYSNPYVCSGCTGGDPTRCGSYGCQ